jgi:S-(hydroxymethyl)glutathione dehydrogenase/alcohol dehydrogenase
MRAVGEEPAWRTSTSTRRGREVLVRTGDGVCHSDLHVLEGLLPNPVPTVLGHEPAGVVEAVGPEVRHVAPGDHVIGCLSAFCGTCEYCVGGRPYLCEGQATMRGPHERPRLTKDGDPIVQFVHLSAFAERMLVHENALVKIRPDVPLDRVALIGCGVAGPAPPTGRCPRQRGRRDRCGHRAPSQAV